MCLSLMLVILYQHISKKKRCLLKKRVFDYLYVNRNFLDSSILAFNPSIQAFPENEYKSMLLNGYTFNSFLTEAVVI